jgi:TRAP-type C4-dicarboxylate transport system permease small subunit
MSERTPFASREGRAPDALPVTLVKGLIAVLDNVSFWAIAAAMAGMALIVIAQVVARYLFDSSIDSADELSRLLFVWVTFLALPHGIKIGIHVGIDIVVRMVPAALQRVTFRVVNVICAPFMALLGYLAVGAIADKWQDLMPTLEITSAVFYMPILICAVHGFFHFLALAAGGEDTWLQPALAGRTPTDEHP